MPTTCKQKNKGKTSNTARVFPLPHNTCECMSPPAAPEPRAAASLAMLAGNGSSQSHSLSSPGVASDASSVSCGGASETRGSPRNAPEEQLEAAAPRLLNDKAVDVVGAGGGAAGAVLPKAHSDNSVLVPVTLESTDVPLAPGSDANRPHTTTLFSGAGVAGSAGAGGLDIGVGERGSRKTEKDAFHADSVGVGPRDHAEAAAIFDSVANCATACSIDLGKAAAAEAIPLYESLTFNQCLFTCLYAK